MKKALISMIIVLSCTLILGTHQCNAQFTQEWVSTYNLSDLDQPYDITCRNDFIYVAGYTVEGYWGPLILKYNKYGRVIWTYKNIYMGYGSLRKILTDSAENVYVTGSFGGETGDDITTFKLDSKGNLNWFKRYTFDSLSNDNPSSMCLDNSGNVYVTGSSSRTRSDAITIKYDSSGNQRWVARYLSTLNGAGANDIKFDKKGFIYVAASREGKATLLKYDTFGNLKWFREYGPGFGQAFSKLEIDDSSRIYLTGYSASYGLLMVYNENGDLIKLSLDKPANVEYLQYNYCKLDKWNNLYAVGKSDFISGNMNICLVKYNSQGILLWSKIYDSGFGIKDYPIGMDVDKYGNCYIVGRHQVPYPWDPKPIITLAYDKFGNLSWDVAYYGEDSLCNASAIAVDTSGGVYVTGESSNNISNTGTDIVVIKYNSLVGINPVIITLPKEYSLSQNYPNPFNPSTTIKYSLPKDGFVSLKIYDITGREVKTLAGEVKKAGYYSVTFNASSLASGVYFYRIQSNDFVMTKRMVLIK